MFPDRAEFARIKRMMGKRTKTEQDPHASGPPVETLIGCAENLAKNYQPTGIVSFGTEAPDPARQKD